MFLLSYFAVWLTVGLVFFAIHDPKKCESCKDVMRRMGR